MEEPGEVTQSTKGGNIAQGRKLRGVLAARPPDRGRSVGVTRTVFGLGEGRWGGEGGGGGGGGGGWGRGETTDPGTIKGWIVMSQ